MNEPINMQLSLNDVNLLLEALGGMPYYRVHEIIHKIQSQAQRQVNKITNAAVENADIAPATTGNGVKAE